MRKVPWFHLKPFKLSPSRLVIVSLVLYNWNQSQQPAAQWTNWRKTMDPALSAGKCEQERHDWFWFCFTLVWQSNACFANQSPSVGKNENKWESLGFCLTRTYDLTCRRTQSLLIHLTFSSITESGSLSSFSNHSTTALLSFHRYDCDKRTQVLRKCSIFTRHEGTTTMILLYQHKLVGWVSVMNYRQSPLRYF